MVTIVEYVKNT